MVIVWDEPKRIANVAKHSVDFAEIDLGFFASAVVREAHSDRFQALGALADGRVVSVVFKPLGTEAISLISVRYASAEEREFFND